MPDQAIALLEKGLAAQPDKWGMQDIGFVHYWWRQDYQAAAKWFDKAGQVPGAPWFLRSLAATTVAAGGDRQSSRLIWQSLYDSAELDWLRQDAEKHLLQLEALDTIDQLLTSDRSRGRTDPGPSGIVGQLDPQSRAARRAGRPDRNTV